MCLNLLNVMDGVVIIMTITFTFPSLSPTSPINCLCWVFMASSFLYSFVTFLRTGFGSGS